MRALVSTFLSRAGGSVDRGDRCAEGIVRRVGGAVRCRASAQGEAGSVAAEFAMLATLVAGTTLGVAAVIGASVEHPLEALTAVVNGLVGTGG